ncbi:MAG TPA: tRNA pseudouridine(38-40) synthase TruA [Lachnospiraceae bacterium]|nr:tRNA pseudouridine(38-40) synthase TruA [Lachnospiraceae bacterium]
MKNYKIILQYDGTRYQGWQKQDSTDNTLQGKLESLLKKMVGENVEVNGSGRTDSGVHAKGQVANFQVETDKMPHEIMEYMNLYLPEDIAVISIKEVPERFHSRLNAKGKTYEYKVINSKIPHVFERKYAYVVEEKLDIEKMQKAANLLCGNHDFKAFTNNKRTKKSTERTIESIKIEKSKDEIIFSFSGTGFLYHMIRIIMGTLLEVGNGIRKPEDMTSILKSGKRENAGALVPALGLCLMEVRY